MSSLVANADLCRLLRKVNTYWHRHFAFTDVLSTYSVSVLPTIKTEQLRVAEAEIALLRVEVSRQSSANGRPSARLS